MLVIAIRTIVSVVKIAYHGHLRTRQMFGPLKLLFSQPHDARACRGRRKKRMQAVRGVDVFSVFNCTVVLKMSFAELP